MVQSIKLVPLDNFLIGISTVKLTIQSEKTVVNVLMENKIYRSP